MGAKHIISLPDIGEGVVEGEVIEWLKNLGDIVAKDEPVVTVMTDKATVELPSPYAGKLIKQYYQAGETAVVDKPLYEIETESEVIPVAREVTVNDSVILPCQQSIASKHNDRLLATPKTRQLAKELGVDIGKVTGTGKEGRITDSDVIALHAGVEKKPVRRNGRAAPEIIASTPILHMDDDEEVPISGLRNIIAEKMVESKYIIPHFSYFDRFDCARLIKLRESLKQSGEKEGVKVTYMPLIIKALSLTIMENPILNSSVDLESNKNVIHKHHHIGIATNSPEGLRICVLKNVEAMDLNTVIREYDKLMTTAREGKLDRDQLIGSTITISNFGPLGGRWATPIINYPEVSILGVAKICKEPVVKDDQVVIQPTMNLSWSFDHRVINGFEAAKISNRLIDLLKNPAHLLG